MRRVLFLMLLLLSFQLTAGSGAVYVKTVEMDLEAAYRAVYGALEEHRFWVVFEADMGERMAGFKDRWGEDYNRGGLDGARSMVFCNIWWTNQIANADPDLLALCPLHVSLYAQAGKTSIVMLRPSVIAEGSPGQAKAAELEQELVGIIEAAFE